MKIQFDILRKSRAIILKEIENLSLEELHKIPDGFKNNIIWNLAHILVTQQLLHYGLTGLNLLCPDDLVEAHRKGTAPTKTFTEEELNELKELLMGLPDTLEEDFEAGIFENYKEYPTSTGYVLSSIENAISFNNFHEGIHYGIIRALKKCI